MPLSLISIRRWTRPSSNSVSLARKLISPPSGVYLTALERMLISTCRICSSLPVRYGCQNGPICFVKVMCRSTIWPSTMEQQESSSTRRSNDVSSICILPDSILVMSSTSLMRESRWDAAPRILVMQSRTRALLSKLSSAMSSIPIMPLMGVRMSWDMLDRNSVLATLASSALRRAFSVSARNRWARMASAMQTAVTRTHRQVSTIMAGY